MVKLAQCSTWPELDSIKCKKQKHWCVWAHHVIFYVIFPPTQAITNHVHSLIKVRWTDFHLIEEMTHVSNKVIFFLYHWRYLYYNLALIFINHNILPQGFNYIGWQ